MDEIRFETRLDDGIERVICRPASPTHPTPILFLHGMWHGAWCWEGWQRRFAEQGWESHAISLPGHGASSARGPVRLATLDDYLAVVSAEVARFPAPPILIGHSMGGALAQWYLKKVADTLPAVVMVASWTSHSTVSDGLALHLKRDPWGFLKSGFTRSSTPLVRRPKWVASLLLGEHAIITPDDLYGRLCEESGVVLSQHNPPAWIPPSPVASPMLWVAAEKDAVITLKGARASAQFYGADFHLAPNAGHDLMFEQDEAETAAAIETWLTGKSL